MKDMNDQIDSQVIAILAAQALRAPETITPGDRLEALGIDSLGMVEIIFAIEETFEVSVPFNANEPGAGGVDLSSVGAVIAAVRGLVGATAG